MRAYGSDGDDCLIDDGFVDVDEMVTQFEFLEEELEYLLGEKNGDRD